MTFKIYFLIASSLFAAALAANYSSPGKNFQQWGFLILENTDYTNAEAHPAFQEIQTLKNNRLLSQYYAVAHPSLPNYVASIAGSTFGVLDDAPPSTYNFTQTSIIDLLETAGISWKAYVENYPGGCNREATDGISHSYVAKHMPFVYFEDIYSNAERCAKIVPASEFQHDLDSGDLPQWWYYTPNLSNDGHDTDIDYVASYLQTEWLPRFKNSNFTKDLAMVMTYDEDETSSIPNRVYAALIGDAIQPGPPNDTTTYSHYSLIKTVEDNWALGSLNRNDTNAAIISMGTPKAWSQDVPAASPGNRLTSNKSLLRLAQYVVAPLMLQADHLRRFL